MRAAVYDRYGHVDMLIRAGADVNAADAHGWTPLHYATHYGAAWAADELLRHGADPNRANADGLTPLDFARDAGRPDLVDLLLQAGGEDLRESETASPQR